jgi:uncharacterized phage protein (TIGR01671 family)
MNREIKFRAWDTKDNEMYFPQVLAFGLDLKIKPLRNCKDGNNAYKHHELMQFTGLQDKNGKDIYEGDIVKHSGIICKVVYGKKGACFSLFDVRLGETDLYVITDLSAQYMEVIGNEFENPELLTPKP